MKNLILVLYFFHVCLCLNAYEIEVKEEIVNEKTEKELLNGTLFRTAKKYYCRSDSEEDEELILYGTNAWEFPVQDVKLVFRYPSENQADTQENVDYILTGLSVILQMSGSDSKGYITSGGMLQNNINVMFVFRNVSRLSYQLFLYGVPRSMANVTENYTTTINLC